MIPELNIDFPSPCLWHIPWQCKKKQKLEFHSELTEACGANCENRNLLGTLVILRVVLSSVKPAWERTPQPLLRMPEMSYWKCSPQAKIKFVHPIQEQWAGKPEGGKPCSPRIFVTTPRTFFLSLPAAPINSHSNQPTAFQLVQREAGMLQTEARGSVTQAAGTRPVCLKLSHSISLLTLIPRLPDGSLLSPFSTCCWDNEGAIYLGLCTKQFPVFWCSLGSGLLSTEAVTFPHHTVHKCLLNEGMLWYRNKDFKDMRVYRSEVKDMDKEAVLPKGMKRR